MLVDVANEEVQVGLGKFGLVVFVKKDIVFTQDSAEGIGDAGHERALLTGERKGDEEVAIFEWPRLGAPGVQAPAFFCIVAVPE